MFKYVLMFSLMAFSVANPVIANAEESKLIPVRALDFDRELVSLDQIALQTKTLKKDVEAQFETGLRYYFGYKKRLDIEFVQDYVQAAEWFEKAAAKGHVEAAYFLGHMFEKGQGVPQSVKNAVKAYEFAAEKGLDQATHRLALLNYHLYLETPDFAKYEKQDYLDESKQFYSELVEKKIPGATYNLAIIRFETEMHTRDLLTDVNDLLISALEVYISEDDREHSLKIIKFMRENKLNRYEDSMGMYREAFIGDKKITQAAE